MRQLLLQSWGFKFEDFTSEVSQFEMSDDATNQS